jgi:hypothetical protein
MNIKPIPPPTANAAQPQATAPGQDSRSRAIAKLNSLMQAPVANPNQVAPEEMGAITTPSGQIDTTETVVEATTDEVTTSPVVEETPAKPLEDPTSSAQFAALARREKALRAQAQKQQQALQAREDALKAREAQIQAEADKYKTGYISKDQLKSNALQMLSEAGVSYDELTQQVLNQQPTDPRVEATIKALEAKIAKLEASTEESKTQQTQAQAQQYQAAIKQITSDVKHLVDSDPSFEAIKATNSVKDVVELIEKTYADDGTLLSPEEAAQMVEDHLVEELSKYSKIKKIQDRLTPPASKAAPVTPTQTPGVPAKQPQPMKTLTNANSAPRQMTARERAIAAMEGRLK